MAGVDLVTPGPPDKSRHRLLAPWRDDLVTPGYQHRGGNVQLGEPNAAVVGVEGHSRLYEGGQVGHRPLRQGPVRVDRPGGGGGALVLGPPGQPLFGVAVPVPGPAGDGGLVVTGDAPSEETLPAIGPFPDRRGPEMADDADGRAKLQPPGEAGRGGAQHEALGPFGVAFGEHLGDGPAHRVADDDSAPHPKLVLDPGNVVGAPVHGEGRRAPPQAAVPAQVRSDDPERAPQVPE